MSELNVRSSSVEETKSVAGALARVLERGDLVVLVGGLGAGKTTFTQGVAVALGVEGPVTSPTFTLVRHYRCALGQLLHADLYRSSDLDDAADLGLDQLREEGAVLLVEWGETALPVLGEATWWVRIDADGPDARRLAISANQERRLAKLHAALGAP